MFRYRGYNGALKGRSTGGGGGGGSAACGRAY